MKGRIEVVCGGVRSGKSELLIQTFYRFLQAEIPVLAFKSNKDTRSKPGKIESRNGCSIDCYDIDKSNEIQKYITSSTKAIIIDEAQFLDSNIVPIVSDLADSGYQVCLFGLDMDFHRKPFGAMGNLMAIADEVKKLRAICQSCKSNGMYSYLKKQPEGGTIIVVGDKEYEVLCRKCFVEKQNQGKIIVQKKLDI